MSAATSGWIMVAGLLAASMLAAAEPQARPTMEPVAKLATVTARDGTGRPHAFEDAGNREFAVTYDAWQRVRSIEATQGPHINDIVGVDYTASGALISVRFRTGYAVFFDHRPNGTQVVRDSEGGALMRAGGTSQSIDGSMTESSLKLARTLAQFETLLAALGQSTR
ncbi:hypothetical protein ACFPN2_28330 [Steroidobacter flavus]|uniref:Uncharacterized protein n=1 Tax=Steroidobacter flavus TaxID=1842136 RepID=A0ABV8SZK0_9GAMM